ncbi:DinB family protein [Frankia sp. AiPs1]|uniref:DinB family protein n=1 Tax=Frankia sp. AiPs1 TaxID=573493 RepID=UPI0020431EB7|nr:DinB family protein [Frankia sp. AiPs1]MCM3922688.1 DinB family protein [Frankia sp. AiPs1]
MEQVCSECDFDASAVGVGQVAVALGPVAERIVEHLRALPGDVVRHRPGPGIWSPIEYLGHLRESMAFHRWLIERAAAEQTPVIPTVDPDASVAAADYHNGDLADLLGQFERRVARLRETMTQLDEDLARRTVDVDGRVVSVALVARSALHECHHHDGDIVRAGQG